MPLSDDELIANVELPPEAATAPEEKPPIPTLEEFQAGEAEEAGEDEAVVPEVAAEEETPAEEADAVQEFTLKVDGEDKTVTLDELMKGYGTNTAAQKKFNDAALARKQAEEFIHQLKTNPWDVLSNPSLGLNPRELAETYLSEQLQIESLTDEQRELMTAKQQLHQFETQRRQQEQAAHDQQLADLTEKYNQEYITRIDTALADAGIAKSEASIRRLAGYMSESLASDDPKIQNLSDSDLCELVRQDYEEDFKLMFAETDAETLQKILGDDVANTLRQADIKKLTGKKPTRTKNPVKGNKNVQKKDVPKIGMDDFHNYLDSL